MARIDYSAIRQELREIIAADPAFTGMQIVTEEEVMFGLDQAPWIAIYLERREAPEGQYLSAGTKQLYRLRFSIWVFTCALEMPSAIRQRDEIIGKLEVLLMGQRTINDMVETSWLEGGEMPSAKMPDNIGVVVGGEIRLVSEIAFTST